MIATTLLTLVLSAGGVEVTYLGNEGFLLEAEGRKVLVDALVSRDMPDYVKQSGELRKKLENAEPPFAGIDLILATHVHGDHFDAHAVKKHLAANPKAIFVSTEQAVQKLKAEYARPRSINDRVRAIAPRENEPVELKNLRLTVFNLHHGVTRNPPIQNHGFLIDIGGKTFLHMGDTEVTSRELMMLDLPRKQIDVAFVPSWYLDAPPWKGSIETSVRPKQTVVMHLAPGWAKQQHSNSQKQSHARVLRIRENYPDAIILEEPLEKRLFE